MLKQVTQRVLRLFGFRLVRVPRQSFWDAGVKIEGLPEYPDLETIIDVGVAGGTPWLYAAYPKQNLLLVEPLNVVDSLNNLIKDRDYEMFECAVGAAEGEIEIAYDMTMPARSSVNARTELTENRTHTVVKRTVPLRTLDSLVAESRFGSGRLGLKIDAEGFELEILKGATETLARTDFVVCEVSAAKRFEDSYDFSELIVYLHSMGFAVSRILHAMPDGNGIIRFADLLFERRAATSSK